MQVEVVAVVEVPVGRGDVADELRGLMDGVVVPPGYRTFCSHERTVTRWFTVDPMLAVPSRA